MRASMSTCLTATSTFLMSAAISSSLVGVSCTNSVLVRASTTALPRLESTRCAGSASSFWSASAFW